MKKVELQIIALANSESNMGNFTLVLEEESGLRRLPIVIGPFEAQAIAVALERMYPKRPMTHDLFKNTLEVVGVELEEVFISKIESGIFHATLMGKKMDGSFFEVDARSSDAIAMAVRFSCPIFIDESIMRDVGVEVKRSGKEKTSKKGDLSSYSIPELEAMLTEVLEKEDYEKAVKIRNAMEAKK